MTVQPTDLQVVRRVDAEVTHRGGGGEPRQVRLDPVHRVSSVGFALHEITRIERIVRAHREGFLEAWHDHFDA